MILVDYFKTYDNNSGDHQIRYDRDLLEGAFKLIKPNLKPSFKPLKFVVSMTQQY